MFKYRQGMISLAGKPISYVHHPYILLFGANIYMNNQMRLTSYKPTQPNPGEDIHHTVISCVGN